MNYDPDELRALGIACGVNVRVDRSVRFFGPNRIRIGSNVRIDCFCILSADAPVSIGDNVHLAAGVTIFGSQGVEIGSFAGLSNRVSIFTAADDFSEGYLTNPTIPERFKKMQYGKVVLGEHVVVGCGSVIMPGCLLGRGAAVGALSLVNKNIPEFLIVTGQPARRIGTRNRERLEVLEREFLAAHSPAP